MLKNYNLGIGLLLTIYTLGYTSVSKASVIDVDLDRIGAGVISKITINSNKPNEDVSFFGQTAGRTDSTGMFMCQAGDIDNGQFVCPLEGQKTIPDLMIGTNQFPRIVSDINGLRSEDKQSSSSEEEGEGQTEGSPGGELGGLFSINLNDLNFFNKSCNCSPQQKSLIEKHYKQHQLSQQKYKPCDLA